METSVERDMFGRIIQRSWAKTDFGKLPDDVEMWQLLQMTTPERAAYAESLRQKAASRARRIIRSGEYSYSLDRMMTLFGDEIGDYGGASLRYKDKRKLHGREYSLFDPVVVSAGRGRQGLSEEFNQYRDAHNALSAYITILQDFLQSQTSTLSGIRAMNTNWDRAIFGTVKRGRSITARHRMSADERKKFWAVYRELKLKYGDIKPNFFTSTDENGLMRVWSRDFSKFKEMSFEEIYAAVVKSIEEGSDFDRVPEASFFGRGDGVGGKSPFDDEPF